GEIRQRGSAAEVFARPANAAIARIVGFENVLPVKLVGEALGLVGTAIFAVPHGGLTPDAAFLAVRAENVHVVAPEAPAVPEEISLPGRVVACVLEGALARLRLD